METTLQEIDFRHHLSREWGWIAFRGIVSIVFGILAFVWPFATVWALAILWGIYVLTGGMSAIAASWGMQKNSSLWWPYLLFGVVGVIAGILAFVWPGITAAALLYVIAFWAIISGVIEIAAAIRLRREIEGEWFLILSGAFAVIFGALLIAYPLIGVLAVVWIIGCYAVASGILLLILAFKIRKYRSE